jgi:2-oxo-4-hydroxy-4-carboxy--5-ureidoimidazoline (OHCU) decarboxylase
MDENIKQLIRAHNDLAAKVLAQEEVIEVLIKGLNAANKANQQMLEQGLNNLYNNFQASGQH